MQLWGTGKGAFPAVDMCKVDCVGNVMLLGPIPSPVAGGVEQVDAAPQARISGRRPMHGQPNPALVLQRMISSLKGTNMKHR